MSGQFTNERHQMTDGESRCAAENEHLELLQLT